MTIPKRWTYLITIYVVNFIDANHNSKSLKYKQKITTPVGDNGRKNVKIMVSLTHLSHFWRNIEMLLINCDISLILTWSTNCVLLSNTAIVQATTFSVTDTKLYVSIVTLSTQDNAKLLQQLKSGFKRTTS